MTAAEALAPLAAASDVLAGIRERTGRAEPDVVTDGSARDRKRGTVPQGLCNCSSCSETNCRQ